MEKFICIHGHFYQPPRENPWLETIELQDSAYPYHDWNERINAEAYAPNAAARLLDEKGRIARLINNYSKISFNFGPTLLAWMKTKAPEILAAIVEADRQSQQNYSGHGSAMAQVYNHMILPLANDRDKYTQVYWGIRDFEHVFNRKPEGMWLPETAADNETLDVLAQQGIRFTVLSPFQASRVRRIGGRTWRDVNGGRIDPSMPYECRLSGGRKIVLFFYDAPVSQAVAFERLLTSGERLAHRLMSAFSDKRNWDQLVHIATDGESYGHHHAHGEMALAYALQFLESDQLARLTNYGEFLEKHPPTQLVEIHQKSAWSCSHGVERWNSNCGCSSGGHPGWNQDWRRPLREALDWLRDELAGRFERKAADLLKNPWGARNEYINVILDRAPESRERFFSAQAARELTEAERITCLKLLEMQRHAMLMYTSCGWFFDELSGIETVQVIQYAARALQFAEDVFGENFENHFLELLSKAKSNIPENGDGRTVYEKFVRPAKVDLDRVVAHYAVRSVFESYPEQTEIFPFTFLEKDRKSNTAGRATLALGRLKVSSQLTYESAELAYGVVYLGEHSLNGGVRLFQGNEAYEQMVNDMTGAFGRGDFVETVRYMDKHFEGSHYSLKSLFRDEQRRILSQIMESTLKDLESRFREISGRYTPMIRFLGDLGVPLPRAFHAASDFLINADLRVELSKEDPNPDHVRSLIEESRWRNAPLERESLSFVFKQTLEVLTRKLAEQPDNLPLLTSAEKASSILPLLPFEVNLWKTQNTYYEILNRVFPEKRSRAKAEGATENDRAWLAAFVSLGQKLGVRVDE